MFVTALALALAPQAACGVTVHEAPPPGLEIGSRVAVDGDLMVALGPRFTNPPTATVWRWSVDGWQYEASFVVPVDPYFFKGPVAISEGDVLIGTTDAFNGAVVQVFRDVGGAWSLEQSLYPFAHYIYGPIDDIDVVARGADVYVGNTWNGEIQRYERSPSGVWSSTVVATGPFYPGGYGHSIDFDDDWLITSTFGTHEATIYPRLAGGALGAPMTLASSFGVWSFGLEVALDEGVAVVRGYEGEIEAFRYDGAQWVSTGAVPIPGVGSAGDVVRMDLRHGLLAVGRPQQNVGGQVIELRHDGLGAWAVETQRRPARPGDTGLGRDVLRTPYGTIAGGDGYVQRWPEDLLIESFCGCEPALSPCGNGGPNGCTNAAGTSARLRACGSRSLADANLAFHAAGLNAGTWGMIFHGTAGGAATPGQNGLVCVGGPVWRYLPKLAHGTDVVITDVIEFDQSNHPPAGRLTAGTTTAFQFWYRDSGGPCGAASNFTNAVSVPFLP